MIITIDGQSGTGKSTLANILAKKLNYKCLNTGMIYRAITYYFLKNDILPDNLDEINIKLASMNIVLSFVDHSQFVKINDIDITPFVSIQDVQKFVSDYSQVLSIREKVTDIQRDFAKNNNIVVEGRDIGTHVFPYADYKFFVSCDINVRANRRLQDLIKLGQKVTLTEVIESLNKRDYLDSTRKYSPLKKAEDAIVIDTSYKTIDESISEILSYIK